MTLRLESLTRAGEPAFGPLSLDIASGECLAVMGPGGAGKTQLIRLLLGLETPTAGEIFLDGRSILREPPHRRRMAWMPQEPVAYPGLDVEGNLRLDRPPISAELWAEVLEMLALRHLLKRDPRTLSGGESRRMMLGRTVLSGRPIWLLDEPLAAVDSETVQRILRGVGLLRTRLSPTIVMVTHDPHEAFALADRVGVLGTGRLIQLGPPRDLVDRPSHRTVVSCLRRPAPPFTDGGTSLRPDGVTVWRPDDDTSPEVELPTDAGRRLVCCGEPLSSERIWFDGVTGSRANLT